MGPIWYYIPGAAKGGIGGERPQSAVRSPAQVIQEKLDLFFGEVNLADVIEHSCRPDVPSVV